MKAIVVGKVASIRRLREQGHGYKAIAKMLHLSSATVYKYSMSLLLSKEAELCLAARQRKRQQVFTKKYARKRTVALTKELAEFTGALLGDGCLSKYFAKSEGIYRYETAFTGSIDDFSYYKETLQPIIYRVFEVRGRLFLRENSTRFHVKSKKVFDFFASLGVPIGEKGPNIAIPQQFMQSMEKALAVVRGLWNTDGSIYRRYNKMYSRHAHLYNKCLVMQLKLNSKIILMQVKEILSAVGIKTSSIIPEKNAFVLRIGDQNAIVKYLKLIGFSNKHHLKRICKFKTLC